MKWVEFECPKCGWTTTQHANAQVTHRCGKGQRPVTLKKLSS